MGWSNLLHIGGGGTTSEVECKDGSTATAKLKQGTEPNAEPKEGATSLTKLERGANQSEAGVKLTTRPVGVAMLYTKGGGE